MKINIDFRIRKLILGLVVAAGSAATVVAAGTESAPLPIKASGEGVAAQSPDFTVPGKKRATAQVGRKPVAVGESREAPTLEPGRELRRQDDDDKQGAAATAARTAVPLAFPASIEELKKDKKLAASDFRLRQPAVAEVSRLVAKAANGPVRVIVTLKMLLTPEGLLGERAAADQRSNISLIQNRLLADLKSQIKSGHIELLRQFEIVPMLVLKLNAEALTALAAHVDVAAIQEDTLDAPLLNASAPAMGSADARNRGYSGSGWNVAVLDTGIDRSHQFLRAFRAEACFSGNSNCPNGTTSQIGVGAAAACTYAPGACSHGTHVAGIATGASQSGLTNREGAARNALLIPVQVFSRFTGSSCSDGVGPCALSYASDQMAGLQYVYNQRLNYPIAAANMSIGSGANTVNCDGDSRKAIIDQLRSANIATVIAAGNDSYINAVSTPACISSAISVGAIDNNGNVAGFSNIGNSGLVDLVAPGVDVVSSCPYSFSSSGFCTKSGTSMAAPHVAGAWAVLQSKANHTVSSNEFDLEVYGLQSRDQRGGGVETNLRRADLLDSAFLNELPLTAGNGESVYRTPRPIRHKFFYTANRGYWSVAAIRQTTGIDVDMSQYNGAYSIDSSSPIASSAQGVSVRVADLVATDHNGGRRSIPDTLGVRTIQFTASTFAAPDDGLYGIQVSDPGLILSGSATINFGASDIVRIYDNLVTAGVRQYVRAVHGVGVEMYAFVSDPGNASSWAQGAGQAATSVVNTIANSSSDMSFTPALNGYAGIAVVNRGGTGAVTLYSDNSAPTGSVSINNGAASTSSQNVTLTIAATDTQTGIDDMRISVDGGANFGAFVPFATSANVTLPAGSGVKTVVVEVRNRAHGPAQFSDTIQFAEPLPALSINDVTAAEGNSGSKNFTFTISLTPAPTGAVTVLASTANGTATAGSDYTSLSTTVSFAAGQTSKTVNVVVLGDTTVEPNETFFVNLSGASGATIADGQGLGTITNDDTAASTACISLPVSSFNFGNVKVGQTSAQRSLPITSCGSGPLNITRIGLTGDFIGTSNCPASLAPGASCALTGSFRPTATGVRNGSVTITSNAPTSPTVVQLTGTGTP